MKTVVSCFLAVLVLLILSSLPARAVEMSMEEIKAFTKEARKLVDEKKVERLSFDRNYTKADPFRVKDWRIFVRRPSEHEDILLLTAMFDSGVVPLYLAFSTQKEFARKMGVPASSLPHASRSSVLTTRTTHCLSA